MPASHLSPVLVLGSFTGELADSLLLLEKLNYCSHLVTRLWYLLGQKQSWGWRCVCHEILKREKCEA